MHGIGVWHQFVEHFRPLRQFLVVGTLLVEQSDGLTVAALSVVELLLSPIDVAQLQQQHAFLDAATRCFLVAFLIVGNGTRCVALCQIDVTDGVVDLVQIVLVVVRGSHTLQPAHHLLPLPGSHHLGHGDASVELRLIGRVLGNHFLESFVGGFLVAQLCFQLSKQIVFAGLLLLSHLLLDDAPQVGNGLFVVTRVDIVVGIGVVPFLLRPPVDGVTAHVTNHVFGVVYPILLNIAFRQPSTGTAVDGRLRLVEAAHIAEGGGSIVEGALVKLRAPHQHPRLPQERVILLAAQPLQIALRLAAFLRPLGTLLDAVQLNRLLTFLYCLVEVALAHLAALLVAHRVERYQLGEVVAVAVFLLQRTVYIRQRAVIIRVITGIERVPPTAVGSVLVGRTTCCQHHQHQQQEHAPYGLQFLDALFSLLSV